ncbi:phage holin family protein [Uruburuella testudinis]|uniref:Phage holin family protein n=1 Tax=Uruburuella testudinis TaxID=1282863 RepID=A0ABY4DQ25_9NEIS|nr:phage holin family protein [Uruburuella testudinis]UOO81154.1 phage holin family protein [Uruburuella testudinis]
MSSLGNHIRHFKTLLYQGSDLMVLRLRLLALDLNAQAGSVLRIIGAIVFAAVMALLGLSSLLFGLNSVLDNQTKIWVFFSIAAVSLLAVAALLAWAVSTWRNRSSQVMATLQDMQQDIAYLRGQTGGGSEPARKEQEQ